MNVWNMKCVKTQNSHLSKHACIIIVCGCTEILQLNTQHTCCKKKEFENETYMSLGTPRKAYEFQCFFVRECRLFSCNLESREALLAMNRSLKKTENQKVSWDFEFQVKVLSYVTLRLWISALIFTTKRSNLKSRMFWICSHVGMLLECISNFAVHNFDWLIRLIRS